MSVGLPSRICNPWPGAQSTKKETLSLHIKTFDRYLFFTYMKHNSCIIFLCVCIACKYHSGAHGGQKRLSNPLELWAATWVLGVVPGSWSNTTTFKKGFERKVWVITFTLVTFPLFFFLSFSFFFTFLVFQTGSLYVSQASLEHMTRRCWHCKHAAMPNCQIWIPLLVVKINEQLNTFCLWLIKARVSS